MNGIFKLIHLQKKILVILTLSIYQLTLINCLHFFYIDIVCGTGNKH